MTAYIKAAKNRLLQGIARSIPGARSIRPILHRWRGVTMGRRLWVGYDCILETSKPDLITVGDNVILSVRVMLIAHFRGQYGIVIEDDVFVGPGAIILPGVRIGKGAVVTAGSVVSSSVPAMTVVQGNPARPIATCGVSLASDDHISNFYRSLRPLRSSARALSSQ